MSQVSDVVRIFFERYEKGGSGSDPQLVIEQYGDEFMFAGPNGVQAVQKDDFVQALPKRTMFFKASGFISSEIKGLEETRLDEHYSLVKVYWKMQFEKDEKPLSFDITASYLLYQQGEKLQIVMQLDHQDLMKEVQGLGLLPNIQ